MQTIRNFIAGQHRDAIPETFLDDVEPATGQVYARLPKSDERDVNEAVRAAATAFPAWSRTPAAERSRLLLQLAQRIEDNLERLAHAEAVDTGKPLRLTRRIDIPRAASNFRYFATAILHTRSEAYRTDRQALNYTLYQPRGVAGLISPWNLPLYLFSWKVAPALATGNTVVAKPSELAPMTAFLLTELAAEVGLPPGVFNVVHGLGRTVGAAIVAHPGINTISFTGGTTTGAEIAKAAAPRFKKIALELGGKNPNIIFADADLETALSASVRSSFENQGQICLCGSRILVEETLYPEFLERFVAAARQLRIGDPLDPQTDQGALISAPHRDKVLSYLALAREDGGRVLCGGGPPARLPERCRSGSFVEPTVIVDLDPRCRVNQEEVFGPLVTVTPFQSEEQAVELANGTPFGLSASLWTRDLARAHRVAEQIESGTVWVNCWLLRDLRTPFGGMKQSGLGREGGDEALRFFTEPKNVCVQYPA